MDKNTILQGNALDVLKTFPPESIDCCISSPPYWALRNYDTKPQVWDGAEGCEHKWVGQIKKWHGDRGKGKCKEVFDDSFQSDFCTKCGAWRGNLGLEPDFNLYIKHLRDIFDEVKRVLKKEGTCWVNLGDTYSAAHTGGQKSAKSTVGANRPEAQEIRQVKIHDLPDKCLCMIPERFAIEMINRGWILRSKIIWHKPNAMPSSASDRFTIDFEYLFFFTKNKKYYFEQQFEKYDKPLNRWGGPKTKPTDKSKGDDFAVQEREGRERRPSEQGRNKRCVWTITTKPYKGAHFAVFPEALIETPIKAGCPEFICKKCGKPREKIYKRGEFIQTGGGRQKETPAISENQKIKAGDSQPLFEGYSDCKCGVGFESGTVLDLFLGSGTTAVVAKKLNRNWLGIELNFDYIKLAEKRIANAERIML